MSDTKMLQAIINGQKALKEELVGLVNSVKTEILKNSKKIDIVITRLDKQGTI